MRNTNSLSSTLTFYLVCAVESKIGRVCLEKGEVTLTLMMLSVLIVNVFICITLYFAVVLL